MTTDSRPRDPASRTALPAIGLAMAGGAPEGAIYEIGAMRALEESIHGLDLNRLRIYVGVSSGAFLSACLANGLTTVQMCRAIVKREPGEHPFVPEVFFRPAGDELRRRLLATPRLLGSALWEYVTRREKRLVDALTVLGRSLPVAVFDNEPIRDYVHNIFSIKGRTDDFRRLRHQLVVVATDLESGEAVRFGEAGWDHVPISTAVQASTALPGLYPPVDVGGRSYVDGILLKTMHASAALEAGVQLLFCINPIVPVDTRPAVRRRQLHPGAVVRRGLPSVLSQTFKTLIHSRMELGLKAYDTRYPDADVVLLETPREDHESFFSNIFSFASRRAVCQRAYDWVRRDLYRRRDELAPVLERHGLALDLEGLAEERDLWVSVGLPEASDRPVRSDREVLEQLAHQLDRLERLVAARRPRQHVA